MVFTLWMDFLTAYKEYIGTGSLLVLFVVALFYIYVSVKREKDTINPLVFLLSIWATIGYAIIHLVKREADDENDVKTSKLLKRMCLVLFCCFIIVISGKRIFSRNFVAISDNLMHMPSGLSDVLDAIIDENDESAGILMMPGYGNYVKSYSSKLYTAYDEPCNGNVLDYSGVDIEAYRELQKRYPDMSKVAKAARADSCRYIVLKNGSYWPEVPLEYCDFEEYRSFSDWTIYRDLREVEK